MISQKLRTIIVDDEQQSIENLSKLAASIPAIEIISHETNPEKAIGLIIHDKPDLIFMDIQMPGKTGFELVAEIFNHGHKPDIIFVTAYDKFAIRAIRYSAFDYLLKPVNRDELESAITRLINKKHESIKDEQYNLLLDQTIRKPKIKFNTTGGFVMIKPEDIIYVEADWNYSEIFFETDKSETVTMNLGAMEDLLSKSEFFRLNRSIIINTTYLDRVTRKKSEAILIKDGKEYKFKIPILNIRKLERFLSK